MCGILGTASSQPITERVWLEKGIASLVHRGPDDGDSYWSADARVGLSHRRLAVVDLSPAAHQPMINETAEYCLIFNGEIYNFKELRSELINLGKVFKSNSDTEVILASYQQWGADCLSRFNGMFAFALYDKPDNSVFIARDRAGEKPLFYHYEGNRLCFASELKALLHNPLLSAQINPDALNSYLYMGFAPGDLCLLKGFHKLPPAHAMIFKLDTNNMNIWRYWSAPEFEEHPSDLLDESELLEKVEDLLSDAVGRQLEADVPVGILLSGGVDSSLITALATKKSDNISTFTIRFPGYAEFDESVHARLIARHFNTRHIEMDAEDISVDLLPELARQYDEPVIDSSMFPTYLVSKLVRQHCTVALGGDGGDELFGGYIHYPRLLWMSQNLGKFPLALRKTISKCMLALLPVGFRGRNWLAGLGTDFEMDLPLIANYFDQQTRSNLLNGNLSSGFAETLLKQRVPDQADLLQRATRLDFNNYLPEDILVKVDRASMLNSLELRAPFLDYRVIELAYRQIPGSLKATINQRKIMLKRLAQKLLPAEFDFERKQGFSIPLAQWIKTGPWKNYFHEVLLDDACVFDRKTVLHLLKGQEKGRNNAEKLFGLVLLELWRQEYSVSF